MSYTTMFCVMLAMAACSVAAGSHPTTFDMKFHDESLVSGRSLPLPHGVTFPAKIQLVNRAGGAAILADGITITATVASPSSISGNVAVTKDGVASFESLSFATCTSQPTAITFTATNGESHETIATLVSGAITVQAVANSELLFDSTSFLNAGVSATAVSGKHLSAVKINVLDSCGNKDASNTGFTIVATSTEGALSGETTATVTNGVAVFTSLSFSAPTAAARVTFTVKTSSVAAVEGKSLVTGLVAVHDAATPSFAIRFKKTQSAFVSVGSGAAVMLNELFSAPVAIEVVNSADEVDSASVMQIVVTTNSGALSGAVATVSNGVATFTGLKFTEMPDGGVAVLAFTAVGAGAASEKKLFSGSVTVQAAPAPFLVLSSTQFAFSAFAVALIVCFGIFFGCVKRHTIKYIAVAPSVDFSTSCQV